jgi:hypothetical protein
MCPRQNLHTTRTLPARIKCLLRPPLAKQSLGKLECEELLADPRRTHEQERARQPAGMDGAAETVEDEVVAEEHGKSE